MKPTPPPEHQEPGVPTIDLGESVRLHVTVSYEPGDSGVPGTRWRWQVLDYPPTGSDDYHHPNLATGWATFRWGARWAARRACRRIARLRLRDQAVRSETWTYDAEVDR